MNLGQYVNLECTAENAVDKREDLVSSIEFLKIVDPKTMSLMEIEMAIQHAAFIADNRNEFKNNSNISSGREGKFIDHVALIHESDIASWCNRIGTQSFWSYGNRRMANLMWNWINGTLEDPEIVVK